MRTAEIKRHTKETKIDLSLNLDGKGNYKNETGVSFFDHMLDLFANHSQIDLMVKCNGDVDVDFHHTVEDIGIVLGQAFKEALKDKKGIARFSNRIVPMDDSTCVMAMDISGRPFLNFMTPLTGKSGNFDLELVEEFLRAYTTNAGINLYVNIISGSNGHHKAEAIFKALALCVKDAVKIISDKVPSTKGVL